MAFNNVLFTLVLIQIICSSVQLPANLYEGSRCTLPSGSRGICRTVEDCPEAISSLRSRRTTAFVRCGFSGFSEIICCEDATAVSADGVDEYDDEIIFSVDEPQTSSTTAATPPRTVVVNETSAIVVPMKKSQQACIEYSNEVPFGLSFFILGGESTSLGEFPHMAALGFPRDGEEGLDWNCGGALISTSFVLTAAHCVVNPDGRVPTNVRLGKVDLVGNTDGAKADDYDVGEVIVHPNYRRSTNLHDVALLRLARGVTYSATVGPACLQSSPEDPSSAANLIVTGWGTVNISTSEKSPTLLKANLTVVPLSLCNSSYNSMPTRRLPNGLTDGMLCAVDPAGRSDSCAGDSGGPLQILGTNGKYTIVGVTSFGIACGGGTPGVYARVATYLDWIESVVWP